jgi:hypothetical protein
MNIRQRLLELKAKAYDEAVQYMKDNPKVPYVVVESKFGISKMTASRLWRRAMGGKRDSGRKAGISPTKKEKPTS